MTDLRATLRDLEPAGEFVRRHVGPSADETSAMLGVVGAPPSTSSWIGQFRTRSEAPGRWSCPRRWPSIEALARLKAMADANKVATSLIGMGYYGTITPPVILRNLLENPGWYTAYTPYQAEVSQGRLEALLTFQQMVVDLTGMEIANASLLDEATAAAEAMTMAHRVSKSRSDRFFVDRDTHPQTLAVVRTRAVPLGIEVVEGDPLTELEGAGGLRRPPLLSGLVGGPPRSPPGHRGRARVPGLVAVASDLLALVLLTPPGELGADIVLGSSQRFGVPMGYGGPHAAFFATKDAHKRAMPGRIIGVSVDSRGRPAHADGAADPRAAHPPREGDLEHLHRPGAAGRDRRHVRRLARPGGPRQDRAARSPADPSAGREAAHRRDSSRARQLFRHAHPRGARQSGRARRRRGRCRHQSPDGRRPPDRRVARRDLDARDLRPPDAFSEARSTPRTSGPAAPSTSSRACPRRSAGRAGS